MRVVGSWLRCLQAGFTVWSASTCFPSSSWGNAVLGAFCVKRTLITDILSLLFKLEQLLTLSESVRTSLLLSRDVCAAVVVCCKNYFLCSTTGCHLSDLCVCASVNYSCGEMLAIPWPPPNQQQCGKTSNSEPNAPYMYALPAQSVSSLLHPRRYDARRRQDARFLSPTTNACSLSADGYFSLQTCESCERIRQRGGLGGDAPEIS